MRVFAGIIRPVIAKDLIDLLSMQPTQLTWPLIVTLEDVFVPKIAAQCLEACEQFSDEYLRAVIRRVAADAERELALS